MTTPTGEQPHLDALASARRAGFVTAWLPDGDGLIGSRIHEDAVDVYRVHDLNDAVGARYLTHPGGADRPLHLVTGTVKEVIDNLLALPRPNDPTGPRHELSGPGINELLLPTEGDTA